MYAVRFVRQGQLLSFAGVVFDFMVDEVVDHCFEVVDGASLLDFILRDGTCDGV